MNFKKLFLILCLFLVLFSAVTLVSADNSYSISKAHLDLRVLDDGLLQVDESYVYNFDGEFNGVYRDIPLKDGESIENIKVWADGAYPVLKQTSEDGKERLKIYLYADEGHTKKISDCKVTVYIQYDMVGVVNVFNDVGALQYKLWGEEWDVGIGELTAYIELPNGTGNEYYLNPEEFTSSSNIDGNVISVKSNSIPQGKYYELLVLMPVDDFSSAHYAKHVDSDGREMIIKNMEDSKNHDRFWGSVTSIAEILSLIFVPLSAIATYFKYGREPKVTYDGIYEREPPTDDPPAVVNAIVDSDTFGEPNKKGFEATIMDLIDRKVFSIHKENEDLFLTINENQDNLDRGETIVVKIMNHFANNGVLNLSKLDDRMDSESNAEWFLKQFENWQTAVQEEYITEDVKSRYFDDTGTVIAGGIGLLGIAVGIIFAIIYFFFDFSESWKLLVVGIIVAALSYYLMTRRDDIFGRWTEEGRVIYLKWKNFKKFLKDNSLMKEHPPESIVVWKKYLIYATSLGVAKSVEKAMNLQIPNVNDYDDGVFMYHYYGYHTFYYSYDSAKSTTSSSDSGSFGSVGGGSGGGGGGAF